MTEPDEGAVPERRARERRQYTRRGVPQVVTPPYFETFERIAVALESIAQQMGQRQVRMPDVAARPRTPSDRR